MPPGVPLAAEVIDVGLLEQYVRQHKGFHDKKTMKVRDMLPTPPPPPPRRNCTSTLAPAMCFAPGDDFFASSPFSTWSMRSPAQS